MLSMVLELKLGTPDAKVYTTVTQKLVILRHVEILLSKAIHVQWLRSSESCRTEISCELFTNSIDLLSTQDGDTIMLSFDPDIQHRGRITPFARSSGLLQIEAILPLQH